MKISRFILLPLLFIIFIVFKSSINNKFSQEDPKGAYKYDKFQKPRYCGSCHTDFYMQWDQSMMSDAYTHHWDEIEYFKLSVPHSAKVESMKDVHEGCNGCHAPLAYLAGDMPPPVPAKNSRANESVSCEVCHLIKGYSGDVPFNHNFIIQPGETKFNTRLGKAESPDHVIEKSDLHGTAEFCGICHNEKNPFGLWVKSTHLELKEGPYYAQGVVCQDCHMTKGNMKTAIMGAPYDDAKLHLFHGAHDEGKLKGVVEMRIIPDVPEAVPGEPVKFTVALFNQKTGHKFPTGSVEDRILWLHVEAKDAAGKVYHLPVDKKGFQGEEFTIGSDVLAYQDMGLPLGIENFPGVKREDVPIGDRIFRMPYLDPEGRMTIMQWNTASFGPDYRIGPRETKIETFTFNVPPNIKPGKMTVHATLNYQLLVKPVGDFLNVPEDETRTVRINEQTVELTVIP